MLSIERLISTAPLLNDLLTSSFPFHFPTFSSSNCVVIAEPCFDIIHQSKKMRELKIWSALINPLRMRMHSTSEEKSVEVVRTCVQFLQCTCESPTERTRRHEKTTTTTGPCRPSDSAYKIINPEEARVVSPVWDSMKSIESRKSDY